MLAELKRSHYRERSMSSLQKVLQYTPIPVAVLVSGLVASDQVQRIKRPSGHFLKSSASAKEEQKIVLSENVNNKKENVEYA
jgi:hypothetical protein